MSGGCVVSLVLLLVVLAVIVFVGAAQQLRAEKRREMDNRLGTGHDLPEIRVTVTSTPDPARSTQPMAVDYDPWEGGVDYETSVPVRANLDIGYRDAKGQVTQRKVTVKRAGPAGIIAHCHLRDASRTFLFSRMIRLVNTDTGELVTDPWGHFLNLYQSSPDGQIDKVFSEVGPHLGVLLSVAKADGRMLKPERAVISRFIRMHCPDLGMDDEQLDQRIKALAPPTQTEFRAFIREASALAEDVRRAIMEAARAIVATQKTVDPLEEAALKLMEQAFKLE